MNSFFNRAGIWWGVLGLELILVLSPMLVTDYPPLSDLPNHLARIYILADGGKDPTLAQMYRPVWHAIPNLAVDLIGPPLLMLSSVSIAGRILLALAVTLCLAGTIAFHRASFGSRSYWPLAVGLVLYNAEFLLGFINFVIGTGIALLAAAAAVSKNRTLQRFRVPISCIAALIVFFCHAWAFLLYLLLLAVHEVNELWARPRPLRLTDFRRSVVRLVLPAIAPIILIFKFTPHSTMGGPVLWSGLGKRLIMGASPFINYFPALDFASLLLVAGTIGVLLYRGALAVPRPTVLTLAILGLLFIVCPWGSGGAFFLNARLALFVAIMLFAGLSPRESSYRRWQYPAVIFVVLLVVRTVVVGDVWRQSKRDMDDFRALGAMIPRGSRVLAAEVRAAEDPSHTFADQPASRQLRGMLSNVMYLPSLWIIERDAFFPLLFSNPALQPLEVTEQFRRLSVPFGVPPDYRDLFDVDRQSEIVKEAPYLANWQQNFDYLVVMNAGRARHLDGLETLPTRLVQKTDIAALYRIER